MSVVEDVRKVLQDFLAPEVRSITLQMESIQKQLMQLREDGQKSTSGLREDTQKNFATLREETQKDFTDLREEQKAMEQRLLRAIDHSRSEVLLVLENLS